MKPIMSLIVAIMFIAPIVNANPSQNGQVFYGDSFVATSDLYTITFTTTNDVYDNPICAYTVEHLGTDVWHCTVMQKLFIPASGVSDAYVVTNIPWIDGFNLIEPLWKSHIIPHSVHIDGFNDVYLWPGKSITAILQLGDDKNLYNVFKKIELISKWPGENPGDPRTRWFCMPTPCVVPEPIMFSGLMIISFALIRKYWR
jgi:hypothetical protein